MPGYTIWRLFAVFIIRNAFDGAFLTGMIGSPVGILIVLIALRTIIDVKFHLRQHKAVVSIR
jgi:hypothetical protein